MNWSVKFRREFKREFDKFPLEIQSAMSEYITFLRNEGPKLPRPHADTLKGSKHENMKELRCKTKRGEWRIAFAFDPNHQAILLAGGKKSGVKEKRFYKRLIERADKRYNRHLEGE